MSKKISFCPECDAEITFKKPPSLGQIVKCRYCKTELEVTSRTPITLEWSSDDTFVSSTDDTRNKKNHLPRIRNQDSPKYME